MVNRSPLLAAVFLLTTGLCQPVAAGLVTFEFSGRVDSTDVPFVSVGETISGSYTFDTEQPDQEPAAGLGEYDILGGSVTLGPANFALSDRALRIGDNLSLIADSYQLVTGLAGPVVNGFTPQALTFSLLFGNSGVFNSDALVIEPVPVDQFGLNSMGIEFNREVAPGVIERAFISAELFVLEPVVIPLPGSELLLSLGIVGLLLSRQTRGS